MSKQKTYTIDNFINAFVSDKTILPFSEDSKKGIFTMSNNLVIPFAKKIKTLFEKDQVTADILNFIQDIIEHLDPNIIFEYKKTNSNDIHKVPLVSFLESYLGELCKLKITRENMDVIKSIRPTLFKKLGFGCFGKYINLLNAEIFRTATKEQLIELSKLPPDTLEKITPQQINLLKENPIIKQKKLPEKESDIINSIIDGTIKKIAAEGTKTTEIALSTNKLETPKSITPQKKELLAQKQEDVKTNKEKMAKSPSKTKEGPTLITETQKTQEDIKKILDKIRAKLDQFNDSQKIKLDENLDKLKIDNILITAECMLNNFAADDKFLPEAKKDPDCITALEKFKNDKDPTKFDIGKLINSEKIVINDKTNRNFFENLYNFVIKMVKVLTEKPDIFKDIKIQTQINVLDGIKEFIIQTIKYQTTFMKIHEFIDDSLITSGYNMLLLLYTITTKHANISITYTDLDKLYNKLITQIQENIKIYKELEDETIPKLSEVKEQTWLNKDLLNLIETATKDLYNRLTSLKEQRDKLRKNVDEIKNNTEFLLNSDPNTSITDKAIRDLAEKLELRISTGIITEKTPTKPE